MISLEYSPTHCTATAAKRRKTLTCHVFQHHSTRLQLAVRCAKQKKLAIRVPAASSGDEHGGYGRAKTGVAGHHLARTTESGGELRALRSHREFAVCVRPDLPRRRR